MSARRFIAMATVIIVAGLCAPAAAVPGFNVADAIVLVSPFAVVAIVARPRRPKTPAGGTSPTPPAGPPR